MELTPEQRDRIQQILETELRDAFRSAVGDGVRPADVAALVADRRRALAGLRPELADDAQHPVDEAGEGGGVAQPR